MFSLHFSKPIRNIFKLCWTATLRNYHHGNRFVVCITCCHNGGSQLWTKSTWEEYPRGIWKYIKVYLAYERNWDTHMTFNKLSLEIINSNYFSCNLIIYLFIWSRDYHRKWYLNSSSMLHSWKIKEWNILIQ